MNRKIVLTAFFISCAGFFGLLLANSFHEDFLHTIVEYIIILAYSFVFIFFFPWNDKEDTSEVYKLFGFDNIKYRLFHLALAIISLVCLFYTVYSLIYDNRWILVVLITLLGIMAEIEYMNITKKILYKQRKSEK